MSNENDSINKENTPPNINLKDEISIVEHTPLTIQNIKIEDILDKEVLKNGAEALIALINQIPETEKNRLEIRKKELDNDLFEMQSEIEKIKLENETINIDNNHANKFDIRNKVYSFIILIAVIIACISLKQYDILEKGEAKLIIVISITITLTSNT